MSEHPDRQSRSLLERARESWFSRPIPGIPEHWQNFLLCMSFHILLPLLPLGLELWHVGTIGTQSTTLVAAMYAITIGGSSRSKLLFGLGIIMSIVFSIAFGQTLAGATALKGSKLMAELGIVFVILTHGIERYNRHVAERAPFWSFVGEEVL